MIRLTGAITVLCGTFYLGRLIAMIISLKINELKILRRMMTYLYSLIEFNKDPLDEAFNLLADRTGGVFGLWIKNIAKELEKGEHTFRDIWYGSLSYINDKTSLGKEDIRNLEELGQALSYMELDTSLNGIKMYMRISEERILEAERKKAGQVRTAYAVSMMSGVFLLLIIL